MEGERGIEQHTWNTRDKYHGYRDDICNNQEEAEKGKRKRRYDKNKIKTDYRKDLWWVIPLKFKDICWIIPDYFNLFWVNRKAPMSI